MPPIYQLLVLSFNFSFRDPWMYLHSSELIFIIFFSPIIYSWERYQIRQNYKDGIPPTLHCRYCCHKICILCIYWIYQNANRTLFYDEMSFNVLPSILQCQNGHTLCSTCKSRVNNRCPTCRQELGDIRCLALEKVAESLELPCKYYTLGCPEIFPYYSKLKHEAQCSFRPYNCPYAGSECSAVGDIPVLVTHLRDDHKVDMHTGCTFNHRYVKSNPREVENATWMLTVSTQTSVSTQFTTVFTTRCNFSEKLNYTHILLESNLL